MKVFVKNILKEQEDFIVLQFNELESINLLADLEEVKDKKKSTKELEEELSKFLVQIKE